MPTPAQLMQAQTLAPVPLAGRVVTILNSTEKTITTPYGKIPNATGITRRDGHAVTIYINGAEIAIGYLSPA